MATPRKEHRSRSISASDEPQGASPGNPRLTLHGRGAQSHVPNRFEKLHIEADWQDVAEDIEYREAQRRIVTEYYVDQTESIVSENHSPDLPFRWSINPYRGCQHGCSYCYARPSHEYLGLSAGVDFESKIFVKPRAAELFREWLARSRHEASPVMMSGVTDCYQPIERQLALTRACLGVAWETRHPITLVTKNALVTRDLDLLVPLAQANLVQVALSVPTLDAELARVMEPRASTPAARLRAMGELSRAGVPTSVLVAPIVPGLTDFQIPQVLQAAADAGAHHAGSVLLRLPLTVVPVFLDWLKHAQPLAYDRVTARIQDTRGGQWYDADFSQRQTGTGPLADQIQQTFRVFAKKYRLDQPPTPLDTTQFTPPRNNSGQGWLF